MSADRDTATLITSPGHPFSPSPRVEGDALTALCRGLADALRGRSRVDARGRVVALRTVLPWWADPEETYALPAAAVLATGDATYDPTALGNRLIRGPLLTLTQALLQTSELSARLTVQITSIDPVERAAVVGITEDAMSPVDWMAGLRMELPYYHNAHATYLAQTVRYTDSIVEAKRRIRVAEVAVTASVPVYRLLERPVAQPRLQTTTGRASLD